MGKCSLIKFESIAVSSRTLPELLTKVWPLGSNLEDEASLLRYILLGSLYGICPLTPDSCLD